MTIHDGCGPACTAPKEGDVLSELRLVNVRRVPYFGHPLDAWSPFEWAGAMVGESGEAINLAKKVRRGDFDLDHVTTVDGVTQTIAEHITDEVADTVIYGDLLCARMRTSLREAIVRKFNQVSARRDVPLSMTGGRTDHRTQLVKVLAWACHSEDCPASSSFPEESTCNCDIVREEESDVSSAVMMNEARASLGLPPQKVKRKCSECDGAGIIVGATCQNCDGNGSFDIVPNTA